MEGQMYVISPSASTAAAAAAAAALQFTMAAGIVSR
jgi:hypothetical protein